jgi:hypothetical protein
VSGGSNVQVGGLAFHIGAGDIDGDGDVEVIIANFADANISVVQNLTDPTLAADVLTLSVADGGSQDFTLRAGSDLAGKAYWIFGSISGTAPGIDFADGVHLALNYDAWFGITANYPDAAPLFSNTMGILDGDGRAEAAFSIPAGTDPILTGVTFHHAYVVYDPAIEMASNPVAVSLVP